MNNKEEIIKAIANYDSYSDSYRKILTLLVELAIDDVAHITVIKLKGLTIPTLSREIIYQALNQFQQDGLIEIIKKTRGKTATIKGAILRQNKFEQLRSFYIKELEVQKKYIKNKKEVDIN